MMKLTKDDLTSKSKVQLAALFREASRGLIIASADLAAKQSLVAAIRAEIAKRRLSR